MATSTDGPGSSMGPNIGPCLDRNSVSRDSLSQSQLLGAKVEPPLHCGCDLWEPRVGHCVRQNARLDRPLVFCFVEGPYFCSV